MKSHKEGTSKNQRARKVGFLEDMPTKNKAFF
jgi:ribosomal protein L34